MTLNPYESPKSEDPSKQRTTDTHGRAVVVALSQQAVLLLLASLVLDGGRTLRLLACALVASWGVSLAMMVYHRERPTYWAAIVIKYGFWSIVLIVFGLAWTAVPIIVGK